MVHLVSTNCLLGMVVVVMDADGRVGNSAAFRCNMWQRRARAQAAAFRRPACGSGAGLGVLCVPGPPLGVKNRKQLGLPGMVPSS